MEKTELRVSKKTWETPELVIFGNINSLTQAVKPKMPGDADDFATTPGVSTAP